MAAENLRRGLQSLGHEVSVVAPRWRRVGPAYALRRLAFNYTLLRARIASDVLVGIDLDGFALAGRDRPFVAYIMGLLADEARFERGATRFSMRLQAVAERAGARRARLVVTTSEYSRERITAAYGVHPHHIGVARPGIDLDRWRAALDAGRAARGDPTVLTVCHLYRRKNLDAVVRAAAQLKGRLPPVRFRIVGEGPEGRRLQENALRSGVADRVRFLGHLPFELLAREFRSADLFCLPSLQEGFGIVFVEAMAAGLPIVAWRAGSTPEVVRDTENGLLVPPENGNALASAIERLLANRTLHQNMAEVNRRASDQYSLTGAASRFMQILTSRLDLRPDVRRLRPSLDCRP